MEDVTHWLRAALAGLMLIGASVLDLRTRRVPNGYWVPFLGFAAFFALGDVLDPDGRRQAMIYLAAALVTCAVLYVLWWFRLLFGGADAKGLMVLALLWPAPLPDLSPVLTPAWDTLLNGLVFTLVWPLLLLLRNVAAGRFVGLATILGTPMTLDRARASMVWPLQRIGKEGAPVWKFAPERGEDLHQVYHALEGAGLDTVWVTPKVPFMVPLTIGFGLALLFGNVVLRLVGAVLN